MKVLAERYPDAIQGRYKIEIPTSSLSGNCWKPLGGSVGF